MTIAQDIIQRRIPNFKAYLEAGDDLNDYDEYGFTPLIETVITRQLETAKKLIEYKVDINKPDLSGRTPLHWAVENEDVDFAQWLLSLGADANAYTRAGLSVLVFPLLRGQEVLKKLLYEYGARSDFALDFTYAKLIGHRFELSGKVDIINTQNTFTEVNYEGFILEFTIAIVYDALRRFTRSYSTRHLRQHFPYIYKIIEGFRVAAELLKLQHQVELGQNHLTYLKQLLNAPMLILPAASRGHALSFLRYQDFWGKIDRGENALKEGSANVYKLLYPDRITVDFLKNFLFKRQPRHYFHQDINRILGLQHYSQIPIKQQITGNCSWANVQAIVPVAYIMQELQRDPSSLGNMDTALGIYDVWVEWDKDRALDECIYRFHGTTNPARKASLAAMLGAVLFQACDASQPQHIQRAEKILSVLMIPEYYYILKSYLDSYCIPRLTKKGNNLLKLLDECGVNPNIGVNPH